MFKLYKHQKSNWAEVGRMDFDNGQSTVQKAYFSGEVCVVINSDFCLSGNTQDLQQLKNHIDIILGTSISDHVLRLSVIHGYGEVMQEASKQWQTKSTAEGKAGEGLVLGPHVGMTVRCGCDEPVDCEWCCGAGWITKKVKAIKEDFGSK